ncbi:MAG: hypothetical protein ACRDI2_17560 [Chloroflexota bacterium]
MNSPPADPLLDWSPALSIEEALEHVRLARSFLVRMQEALDSGRLPTGERAYAAAAKNLRLRVHRALEVGAREQQVLAAAATAYHSALCGTCRRIYYSRTDDPRFSGLCGDCLYAPQP